MPLSSATAEFSAVRRCIVMHSPEITLKGQNQKDFVRQLCKNVRHRLRRLGVSWPVVPAHGRIYVNNVKTSDKAFLEQVLHALRTVTGIHTLALAVHLKANTVWQPGAVVNMALLQDLLLEEATQAYRQGASFAVRVKRADKTFPNEVRTA